MVNADNKSEYRVKILTSRSMLCSDMDLGPDACLVVLVTRVDITFTSETSYDIAMPFRHPGVDSVHYFARRIMNCCCAYCQR